MNRYTDMKKIIFLLLIVFSVVHVNAETVDPEQIIKSEPDLTIEEVVSSPSEFHGSKILLEGRILKAKNYRLINGKEYTAFEMVDDEDNLVRVYIKGIVDDVAEGKDVRVYGKFSKEESYFFMSFKNVLKAKKILVLKTMVSSL